MVRINGTRITMTRGDTLQAVVAIYQPNGNPYVPDAGDSIRFSMKERGGCGTVILTKEIPIDTLMLTLNPEDTEGLAYGEYGYDIEITMASGIVDTFIPEATIEIRWEAD